MTNYAKIIRKVLQNTLDNFLAVIGLEPGSEKKWYGTYDGIPRGYWTQTAEKKLLNLEKSGHLVFRCTGALGKGQLRSKREKMYSCFWKWLCPSNQLSLYGEIADMIQGLPEDQVTPGRLVASDQTEQEILIQPPIAEVQRQGNLLQDYEQRCERLPEDQKLSKLCSEAGFEFGRSWTIFLCSSITERTEDPIFMSRICTTSKTKRKIVQKGGSERNERFGPVLEVKVCKTIGGYSVDVKVASPFEDQTTSWIKFVKQCRSKKEKKLRGDPLQRRDQHWSRHQQAIRISFRWRIEDGLILKCKNQRTNLAARCRSSSLICFDIEKVGREEDAAVPYDRIIEKCKAKLSKDSRYWPNEVKPDLKMAPHWSAQNLINVLAKGGG